MDLSIYLKPLSSNFRDEFSTGQFGSKVLSFSEGEPIPSFDEPGVVLFGVHEDRGVRNHGGSEEGVNRIRKSLHQLYWSNTFGKVYDIGDVMPGAEKEDTFHAVADIVSTLIKLNCIPVIIGGSQDITYANYLGYEKLEMIVNLVTVDRRFDVGDNSNEPMDAMNYLTRVLLHQPNYLFNYANIGQQQYFVDEDIYDLMSQLKFDSLRLGRVRSDVEDVEPIVRNADIVSIDSSSIKAADAPGTYRSTPNGLTSDEICQVARYAGISDKLTSFGIYEYHPELDRNNQTADLLAQMLWYFIDGYSTRKDDMPLDENRQYLKYRVNLTEHEQEIVFYKSLKTDRWWMNVPSPAKNGNVFKRHQMVPCSYKDYREACEDQMPDLWLKTYERML